MKNIVIYIYVQDLSSSGWQIVNHPSLGHSNYPSWPRPKWGIWRPVSWVLAENFWCADWAVAKSNGSSNGDSIHQESKMVSDVLILYNWCHIQLCSVTPSFLIAFIVPGFNNHSAIQLPAQASHTLEIGYPWKVARIFPAGILGGAKVPN